MSSATLLEPSQASNGLLDRNVTFRDLSQLLALLKDEMAESRRSMETMVSRDIGGLRTEFRSDMNLEFTKLRSEMSTQRFELTEQIGAVRHELRSEIAALRQDMASEFACVRKEMGDEFSNVRKEIGAFRSDVTQEFASVRKETADNITDVRKDIGAHGESVVDIRATNDERINTIKAAMSTLEMACKADGERMQAQMMRWSVGTMISAALAVMALLRAGGH